jgi:hypothetical protein
MKMAKAKGNISSQRENENYLFWENFHLKTWRVGEGGKLVPVTDFF